MDNNNVLNIKSKVGLHNEFDIEVKDIRTGEIRQRGKAYNILLDNIYNRLCNRQIFFDKISFGRGTGVTDSTRTTLFNQIDSLSNTKVEEIRDIINNIYYVKKKVTLLPAQYIGETITEVGITSSLSGDKMSSHALIQDSEGNTISVTKTAYDEVTIYATVYFQLYDNGNIKWSNLPNGNSLLNYLFGISLPSTVAIQVGQSRLLSTDNSILSQLTSKNGSYEVDVANKKLKSNVTFETTEGNGDIFEIGLDKILRSRLPVSGIWDGYNVVNEAVGTGDGINKSFNLKQNYVDVDTAVIKVDGLPMVRDVDYRLSPHKKNKKISFADLVSNDLINSNYPEDYTENDIYKIFDGNVNTHYRSNNIVFPWWVSFDFEKTTYYNIGSMEFRGGYTANYSAFTATIQVSTNAVDWLDIGQITTTPTTSVQEVIFPIINVPFRYIRIYATSSTTGNIGISEITWIIKGDQLIFTNPPAETAIITADYSIDHIPKDANHVLDVGFEIQWGEGSAS